MRVCYLSLLSESAIRVFYPSLLSESVPSGRTKMQAAADARRGLRARAGPTASVSVRRRPWSAAKGVDSLSHFPPHGRLSLRNPRHTLIQLGNNRSKGRRRRPAVGVA